MNRILNKNKSSYKKYVKREVEDALLVKFQFKNKSISQLISSVKETTWKDTWTDYYRSVDRDVLNSKEGTKFYLVPKSAKVDIVNFFNAKKILIDNGRTGVFNKQTYKKDKVVVIFGNSDLIILTDFENKGIKYCVETWLKGVGGTQMYNDFQNALKAGSIFK